MVGDPGLGDGEGLLDDADHDAAQEEHPHRRGRAQQQIPCVREMSTGARDMKKKKGEA